MDEVGWSLFPEEALGGGDGLSVRDLCEDGLSGRDLCINLLNSQDALRPRPDDPWDGEGVDLTLRIVGPNVESWMISFRMFLRGDIGVVRGFAWIGVFPLSFVTWELVMGGEDMGLEDLCSRLDDDGFTVDLAGDATRAGVTGKEALESELARDRVPT